MMAWRDVSLESGLRSQLFHRPRKVITRSVDRSVAS
jgi:hypothetical protein